MCSNRELFDVWFSNSTARVRDVLEFMELKLNIQSNLEPEDQEIVEKHASTICSEINKRWQSCHRKRDRFLKKNKDWLDNFHSFPQNILTLMSASTSQDLSNKRGRPQKEFVECCQKTKKQKVHDLVRTRSLEELKYATDQAALNSSTNSNSEQQFLSPGAALALYLDLDLTERKYEVLRKTVNALHKDCFPSIYALRKAKAGILPKCDVTESSAEVDFQDIMEKTVKSICKSVTVSRETKAKLICKWGFDGSGNHSAYKLRFDNTENSDEYLFLIAFVPLRLVDIDSGVSLWVNDRPGSILHCRPVKFLFKKECSDLVRREETNMQEKIMSLYDHTEMIAGQICNVSFEFYMTMVDGSVCNVLSGTNSSSKCYICGALPSEMNTAKCYEKQPNEENYRFGLSTLHLWIRSFECMLHIAYRLPFKKWRVQGEEYKTLFEIEKKRIQIEFKTKMGLNVDQPKQGFGSSNDGNTARTFFSNPEKSSEITKIDQTLIQKLSVILRVMATGAEIHFENFDVLIHETRTLYLNLYGWYYMPCTLHKLFFHSVDVMKSFHIPIGQLSEEALEGLHKTFRRTRLNHSRKSSRTNNCKDVLNHLLLLSDPFISSQRKIKRKPKIYDDTIKKYIINCDDDDDNQSSSSDTEN